MIEDICSTTKQFNSWWKEHKKERNIGDESISTLASWPLPLKLIRFPERFVILKSPVGRRKKIAIQIVDDIWKAGVSEAQSGERTSVAREKWIYRSSSRRCCTLLVLSKCDISYRFGKMHFNCLTAGGMFSCYF